MGVHEPEYTDSLEDRLTKSEADYHALLTEAVGFAVGFMDRMNKWGEWDDGVFYYNKHAATELHELIRQSKAFLSRPDVQAFMKETRHDQG